MVVYSYLSTEIMRQLLQPQLKNGFGEPSHQAQPRQVSSFVAELLRAKHGSTIFNEKVISLKS